MSQIRYGSYAALRVIDRIVRDHLENVGFQLLSLRQLPSDQVFSAPRGAAEILSNGGVLEIGL
jgi:hypothetical protein